MAKAGSKNAVLEEISEKLEEISSCMVGIEENLDDICVSYKMLVFFKLVEMRPDLKDKLMPLVDEMIGTMDFSILDD